MLCYCVGFPYVEQFVCLSVDGLVDEDHAGLLVDGEHAQGGEGHARAGDAEHVVNIVLLLGPIVKHLGAL